MKNSNQLIVGWGLAGATLAWQMYFNSIEFIVFDNEKNKSTRTAAGVVNPIVFKRLTKSWNADKLMPFALSFYTKIASELNIEILHPKHIFKVFNSFEDENNWAAKQNDIAFQEYLNPLKVKKIDYIDAPYGFGEVKSFGNLDTNIFLDASKSFFIKEGINFENVNLEYDQIDLGSKKYNELTFEHIFFCEGYNVTKNPFFNYLPLKPTHGETLTIETTDFKFEHIINKNMFIMPIKENLFKVGATYNWELKEPITTSEGKLELISKLDEFVNFKYKIVNHQAGIRPTVKDRRPLIGIHPEHKSLIVLNGLGTKGVMIAPFYANQLINSLLGNGVLDKEVNIDRYKNIYTKFAKN